VPKKCVIPQYLEATAEERRLREEVYLDLPHDICGFYTKQITPYLFAILSQMESPVLFGSAEPRDSDYAQFLWALSTNFAVDTKKRESFIERVAKSLYEDHDSIVAGISEFLDATFLDVSSGGREETPYVCSCAWMEYSMSKDPFRWDSQRTLHTPLRRIYQLIRCRTLDNGGTLINNKSDKVKGDWLREFSEHLQTLPMEERQKLVDQINRRNN